MKSILHFRKEINRFYFLEIREIRVIRENP